MCGREVCETFASNMPQQSIRRFISTPSTVTDNLPVRNEGAVSKKIARSLVKQAKKRESVKRTPKSRTCKKAVSNASKHKILKKHKSKSKPCRDTTPLDPNAAPFNPGVSDNAHAIVGDIINTLVNNACGSHERNQSGDISIIDASLTELLAPCPSLTSQNEDPAPSFHPNHYKRQFEENFSLRAQVDLLHSELLRYKKTQNSQRTEIKRLKSDNDNLRKQVSKHSGIRRHTDPSDNREAVNTLSAKLSSLKDQIRNATEILLNAAEPEGETTHREDLADDVTFARAAQSQNGATYASVTKASVPKVSKSTKAPSRSASSKRPDAYVIGTSLTKDVGLLLARRGIDATTFTYSGAELPRIKGRIKHIIPKKNAPQSVVIQAGGNDIEHHPTNQVIKEYDALVKEVKRHAPTSHIMLARVPLRRFDPRKHEAINKLNTYLEDRAMRDGNISFIDTCPPFPAYFEGPQKVHFTRKGCGIYGDKMSCEIINFQTNRLNKQN